MKLDDMSGIGAGEDSIFKAHAPGAAAAAGGGEPAGKAAGSRGGRAKRESRQQRKGGKQAAATPAAPAAGAGAGAGPPTLSPADESTGAVVDRLVREGQANVDELDDYGSAWAKCKAEGGVWGGRAAGGRGVNRGRSQYNGADAVVKQVTIAFDGTELLRETTLRVAHGHRYGLMGRNGVGKTTLMRRIAAEAVPGWPLHIRTCYVQQEVMGSARPVLDEMLAAGGGGEGVRAALEAEQAELEEALANPDPDTPRSAGEEADAKLRAAERLGELYEQLDGLDDAGKREELARDILTGLQFTAEMLLAPVDELSGGWRMRLALGQALYSAPDILLLDEPTNHLDVSACMYLEEYLLEHDLTALIVSHDAHFLDAVCTDMIKFEKQQLKYFVGNYTSFRQSEEEKWLRNSNTAETAARKEKKAREFIDKQRSMAGSKHRDDNKQKQAAERSKKMGRIGLFSENGHKYKMLAEGKTKGGAAGSSNRATHISGTFRSTNGQESAFVSNAPVAFGDDVQLLNFKFPAAAPLSGASGDAWGMPLITMERCAFGYTPDKLVLKEMSLGIANGSRVAIVGKNGAGKSTLVKLLVEDLQVDTRALTPGEPAGKFWRHASLKVAYIAQHHVEQLAAYLTCSPVQYFLKEHGAKSEEEARQFLGGFGLKGQLAVQQIGTLSGGQKARLVFATVMFTVPHVLVLDEPTNHLDADSLASLGAAIQQFKGAVVMVSHNQDFMASCATEMWTVHKGRVGVAHVDENQSFDDIFARYRKTLRKFK
jgi:ATP-binding cassette subfamily F protein 3